MGRFLTPDWAERPTAIPYAVFGDPQSLNLYAMVRNDPVTLADADGHGECNQKTGEGCSNRQQMEKASGTQAKTESDKSNDTTKQAQNACQSGNCNVKVVSDTGEKGTPSPWPGGTVERDVTYQAVDKSGNPVKGAEVSLHEAPLPGKEGGDAKNYSYCGGNGCSNSDPAPKKQGYLAAGRLEDAIAQNRNGPAAFKQTYTVEGKPAKIIWPTKNGNVTALSQTVKISADRVVIIPEVEK